MRHGERSNEIKRRPKRTLRAPGDVARRPVREAARDFEEEASAKVRLRSVKAPTRRSECLFSPGT